MRRCAWFLTVLAASVLVLVQCDSSLGGSDSGGAGADFDAHLYYTKSEIETKLAALEQVRVVTEPVANNYVTGLGYANGTDSYNAPSGFSGAIYQVTVMNNSGVAKTIEVHFSADNTAGNGTYWSTKISLDHGTLYQLCGVTKLYAGLTGVKGWLGSGSSAWDTNMSVMITPLYWLK